MFGAGNREAQAIAIHEKIPQRWRELTGMGCVAPSMTAKPSLTLSAYTISDFTSGVYK